MIGLAMQVDAGLASDTRTLALVEFMETQEGSRSI